MLFVSALILTGLLGMRIQALPPVPLAPPLQPVPGRPAVVDFALPDLNGKIHRVADHRGQVVLVTFWASWCGPCREEMPSMQRLWQAYSDKGFTILGVDVGEKRAAVEAFAFEYDLTFPLLLDPDSKTLDTWKVRGLPTSWLLDKQGRQAFQTLGGREWDTPEVRAVVQSLLDE